MGDLAALEPDQLGARLGPAAVRLWEQATGQATRLLRLVRPTEVFVEQIEFDYEIETAEPLLFVLRRFLEQLTLRLGALYLVAQEMTFRLTFADKSHYEHRFHIPDPTNSVEILFRLLQTHLETFRAEHPIVAVSLATDVSQPARQQFHLFETPLRDPSRLHETLTRLTGLLGRERVGTPVLEDSHRPDAFHLEAFSWELPVAPNEPAKMIGPALRRLRAGSSPALRRWSPGRDRIALREIGGMQKNGSARSGICSWRMVEFAAARKTETAGGWREFMTDDRSFEALRSRSVARRAESGTPLLNDFNAAMSYVELHACSAFSFLRGASFPEQLAERAAELGLPAVALLDRNGVYGAQRFSVACREHGVRPIIGSDLTMEDGAILPVLVENRTGYRNLCSLLTQAHLRSEKGKLSGPLR